MLYWRRSSSIRRTLANIPRPRLPTAADESEERRQSALEHDLEWLVLFETHPAYMRQMTRHSGRMVWTSSGTRIPRAFMDMPMRTDEEFEAARKAAARLVDAFKAEIRIPTYAEANYLPLPCRLFPERVVEYPQELTESQRRRLEIPRKGGGVDESPLDVYDRELSAADGTKLLGHVRWSQAPEQPRCPKGHPMSHVLTIASAEWDGANWPRWRPLEEQRLYESLQASGDSRAFSALHTPTGLMLGDMASKHVFLCRECEDWPVKSIIQD